MSNLRGLTAEKKLSVLNKVFSFFLMTGVHAEEATSGEVTPEPAPQINYEQLIAQARKEEKDKLYPKIKKLEADNAALVKTGNDNLIKIGDLTQTVNTLTAKLADYESGKTVSEQVTALTAQIAALEEENKKLKEETPDVESLRAEIEKEYAVKTYLAEQKAANKNDILSSFLDEVAGTTEEEIDASVTKAKEKSLAIKKELGLVDESGKPTTPAKSNKGTAKKTTKAPATNPTEDTGSNAGTFDADYIRNLDPSSDEYKEFRKSLGLK